jgi:hypothetical protein
MRCATLRVIAKLPGRIGNADDPRAIGILRKDEREAVVEFSDGAPAHRHLANAITGYERGNNDTPLNQAQVNEPGS